MTPLDTLGRRTKDAVQNEVRTAQARVFRETSIVQMANRSLASQAKSPGEAPGNARRQRKPGVYTGNTPDGYRRVTPVQEIRTPPGYRAAILRRAVGAAVASVALAAAIVLLIRIL